MIKEANSLFLQSPQDLRVLVVDDEPDVLLGLHMLVESAGAQVRSASNGSEAMQVIQDWEPHLVFSDIMMEKLSGLQLLESVRRKHLSTKVILITGYGTIELAVSSLQAGAVHFLTKPFDNDDILSAVRRYGEDALLSERIRNMKSSLGDGLRIITRDPQMNAVLNLVDQVAPTKMRVLIQGETGTGKELIARAIHTRSSVSDRPFLPVNSAAIPDTLLESEFFGHVKGAYTGADRNKAGIFERADGGTIFLDEISFMSASLQTKLLRVLEDRIVTPLGSTNPRSVDFRLITATSGNLNELMEQDKFLEELFYRLCVVTIELPPLRERPGDIAILATHFIAKYADQVMSDQSKPPRITEEALLQMQAYPWPGNIRELENCIQSALVICRGEEIRADHLLFRQDKRTKGYIFDSDLLDDAGKQKALERFQREFIEQALARSDGNITHAAKTCGLTRAAFQRIMRSLNIDRNHFMNK